MMELGIGHHGEPGIEIMPIQSAAQMAQTMLTPILDDMQANKVMKLSYWFQG